MYYSKRYMPRMFHSVFYQNESPKIMRKHHFHISRSPRLRRTNMGNWRQAAENKNSRQQTSDMFHMQLNYRDRLRKPSPSVEDQIKAFAK